MGEICGVVGSEGGGWEGEVVMLTGTYDDDLVGEVVQVVAVVCGRGVDDGMVAKGKDDSSKTTWQRYNDLTTKENEATITQMFIRITQKDTCGRTWNKLVRSCGSHIWKEKTAEN